jgi:MFS family permease
MNLPVLAVVFVLAGIYVAGEEALEDSLAAELVEEAHHGMGFGALATVNGVGDLLSSLIVGVLWTTLGTEVAFTYSGALFFLGAALMWRLR